jgi:hypothetical protein
MGKGKKRSPSNRFPVIPKNGGMGWEKMMAQRENMKRQRKESHKQQQIKGNNKTK